MPRKSKSITMTKPDMAGSKDTVFTVESYVNKAYLPDLEETKSNSSTSSGVSSIEENSNDTGIVKRTTANKDSQDGPNSPEKKVESSGTHLKKSMNLLHCTAIMIAVTGHASIFVSPNAILKTTGSVGTSLIVWLVGGLINWMLALCFAELGTMLPKAGGPYAYVMRTFGPLPGFLIMWGYVVLVAGPFWAFLAYTAGLYILKPIEDVTGCTIPDSAVKILSGWIMISMVMLNCVYMKYVTKVQTFLSSTKLLALLILIAGGIAMLVKGQTESFVSPFEGTTQEPGQIAVSIFYAIFSYGGWQVMTSLMEEVKNPGRDLPLSCNIVFITVILKYIMTNVAYLAILSPQEIMNSNAVALLSIQTLYKPITPLICCFVALTSIGALNASIMGHSRLLFAGSRVGHMPLILGMIHTKYLTPWPAIFVLLGWGLAMLYSGGVTDMMEFISLFSTIMGIACVLSVLYLRWKRPNEHRPYKTFILIPVIQLVVNIAVLVLAIYQKPNKMGIGLAILFAGIPIYWLGVLWENKPKPFTSLVNDLTILAQKILNIQKTAS
ncbi:hypothetical protein ACJMK2_009862 [Sinanodonta woodiana]|uniref:Uncharacterized protein n=1 Tax=Sinanodonta woodiana TaxID=1069815 RepID=A0ABD3VDJ1_SINWO